MATRYVWDANSIDIVGQAAFPEIKPVNTDVMIAAFDAAADELCHLNGIAPVGLTGTLTLEVFGFMHTATTGTVGLRAEVEAITPLDAVNRHTTHSFDTINYATSAAVPATAGHEFQTTITLTNKDSIAAGDDFIIRFGRDADGTGSTDSATGDFYLSRCELRDAA